MLSNLVLDVIQTVLCHSGIRMMCHPIRTVLGDLPLVHQVERFVCQTCMLPDLTSNMHASRPHANHVPKGFVHRWLKYCVCGARILTGGIPNLVWRSPRRFCRGNFLKISFWSNFRFMKICKTGTKNFHNPPPKYYHFITFHSFNYSLYIYLYIYIYTSIFLFISP